MVPTKFVRKETEVKCLQFSFRKYLFLKLLQDIVLYIFLIKLYVHQNT